MGTKLSVLFQFLVFFVFLNCSSAWSANFVAKVVEIKGSATKLLPHAREAGQLKVGDQLPEDTSLVTVDHSMVRLVFFDKTKIILGPKTKLVIRKTNQEKQGIVSLLTGQLQAEVRKKVKVSKKINEHKFIVKTQSAALGVRGTSFIMVFNKENQVTSVVTLEGEVSFVKTEELIKTGESEVNQVHTKKIEDLLLSENASLVSAGEISSVTKKLELTTAPVKLAPEQFRVLKKISTSEDSLMPDNSEMDRNLEIGEDLDEPSRSGKNKYVPVAGGFLDLNTALYIPPHKDDPFDPEQNLHLVSSALGSVDPDTGNYLPPAGLILDPVKGFLTSTEDGLAPQDTPQAKGLNQQMMAFLPPTENFEGERVEVKEGASAREGQTTPLLSGLNLNYGIFSEDLNISTKDKAQRRKAQSEPGFQFSLNYHQPWSNRSFLEMEMGIKNLSYLKDGSFNGVKNSELLWKGGLRVGYNLYPRLQIKLGGMWEEQYAMQASSQNLGLDQTNFHKLFLPQFTLSGKYYFSQGKDFPLDHNEIKESKEQRKKTGRPVKSFAEIGVSLLKSHKSKGVELARGHEVRGQLGLEIPLDDGLNVDVFVFGKRGKESFKDHILKRKTLGVGINYFFNF